MAQANGVQYLVPENYNMVLVAAAAVYGDDEDGVVGLEKLAAVFAGEWEAVPALQSARDVANGLLDRARHSKQGSESGR